MMEIERWKRRQTGDIKREKRERGKRRWDDLMYCTRLTWGSGLKFFLESGEWRVESGELRVETKVLLKELSETRLC